MQVGGIVAQSCAFQLGGSVDSGRGGLFLLLLAALSLAPD